MFETVPTLMFFAIIAISHILLFIALVYAAMGYFSKDSSKKDAYFTSTGKLLITCALFTVVGSGSCFLYTAVT